MHPDAVCELQTLAKAHGYKGTKLALVLADVAKAPAEHKVAWLQLQPQGQGTAAREGRPDPVCDKITKHTVDSGEGYESSDC